MDAPERGNRSPTLTQNSKYLFQKGTNGLGSTCNKKGGIKPAPDLRFVTLNALATCCIEKVMSTFGTLPCLSVCGWGGREPGHSSINLHML